MACSVLYSLSVCVYGGSRAVVTCCGCYTHSGPEKAMFVGPGSKCRVDLYKSETRMLKDVFSALGRTILRGRYTPNISSNSSPKPRNYTRTRVKPWVSFNMSKTLLQNASLGPKRRLLKISIHIANNPICQWLRYWQYAILSVTIIVLGQYGCCPY